MTTTELFWRFSTYCAVIAVLTFLSHRREWAGNVAAILLCAPLLFIHVAGFAEAGLEVLLWPFELRSGRPGGALSARHWMAYAAQLSLLAWSVSVPLRLARAGWRRRSRRRETAESIGKDSGALADEPGVRSPR